VVLTSVEGMTLPIGPDEVPARIEPERTNPGIGPGSSTT